MVGVQRIVRSLQVASIVLLAGFVLGFGAETHVSMPYNARVFINPETNRYISPPCLRLTSTQEQEIEQRQRGKTSYHDSMAVLVAVARLYPAVYREMIDQKFGGEQSCADADGFSMKDRSMSGLLLQRLGILGPLPRRWAKDGSWNW